ncbi:MAG: hypothetical protein PUE04_00620 [Lachnospira sp.]|nr:hypothetical protein [Lachnospira sp.]
MNFFEFLKESGSAETTLAAIKAYLWYAADRDIFIQPVALSASHVSFLKVPKLTREIISEEDLSSLLADPPPTRIGIRDQTIMILLYDSAIRVSELVSLNVRSVNLDAAIPYDAGSEGKRKSCL